MVKQREIIKWVCFRRKFGSNCIKMCLIKRKWKLGQNMVKITKVTIGRTKSETVWCIFMIYDDFAWFRMILHDLRWLYMFYKYFMLISHNNNNFMWLWKIISLIHGRRKIKPTMMFHKMQQFQQYQQSSLISCSHTCMQYIEHLFTSNIDVYLHPKMHTI